MGHYRRKPYKKKSMQDYIDIDMHQEIDIHQFDDIIDDIFYEDDSIFNEEPDIVKELREEERQGKLVATLPVPPLKNLYSLNMQFTDLSIEPDLMQRPKNYSDAYQLAKKALKQVDLV